MSKVQQIDWKDVIIRAAKTAVQTFMATASLGAFVAIDQPQIQAAGTAAIAAGISVVWNALAQWAATP